MQTAQLAAVHHVALGIDHDRDVVGAAYADGVGPLRSDRAFFVFGTENQVQTLVSVGP